MTKKIKALSLLLVLLLSTVFVIAGCSNNPEAEKVDSDVQEATETVESDATRLAVYTKDSVDNAMNGFKIEFDKIKDEVENATEDSIETVKLDFDQLKLNVEKFGHEMDEAVTQNKVAEDVKADYDKAAADLKTDMDNLETEINEKMGK